MFRFLGLLFAFILVVPIIRMIVGLLGRLFTNFAFGSSAQAARRAPGPPKAPAGGQLFKDPVCGTFVSPEAAVRVQSGGSVVYFCSEACRAKYQA